MVLHQAVRVAAPAVPLDDVAEEHEESLTILDREKHAGLVVAANADVVVGSCSLQAKGSGHAAERTRSRPAGSTPGV
jgi:hypothetical protein